MSGVPGTTAADGSPPGADAAPPATRPTPPPPPPEAKKADLREVLRPVVAVVANITVLTALLVYFGWRRSETQAHQLGIDESILGMSTRDYLLRSMARCSSCSWGSASSAWRGSRSTVGWTRGPVPLRIPTRPRIPTRQSNPARPATPRADRPCRRSCCGRSGSPG